ncbi:MAG: CvpA family protein [Chloroflexi bacterium]|nr:CvpA family protein [Chloroflexota bacterium]MQC17901.1 CvpA family protein [Chloroflexota bacterium]MQC48447.1 CvpA family protein [Chloroflexota bacterium]
MNWVDLLIAGVIAWTAFRGLRTGLIRQTVWLIAVVVGILLAGRLYGDLSVNLSFVLDEGPTRDLVAFGAIILGAVLAGIVVGEVLRTTASMLMLGPLDSLGGAVVGFVRGVIYVQLMLFALAVFPANEDLTRGVDESTLAPYFLDDIAFVHAGLPSEFNNPLQQLDQWRETLGALLPSVPGDAAPTSAGAASGGAGN